MGLIILVSFVLLMPKFFIIKCVKRIKSIERLFFPGKKNFVVKEIEKEFQAEGR